MGFELGDGYMRFTLRDSPFQRGLGRIQGALTRLRGKLEGVGRFARRFLTVAAGGIALVTRAAMKQEQAEAALDAALRAVGADVDALSGKYRAFASNLQAVTTQGDEVTLAMMAQAAHLGVNAGALDEATKMAIGLAHALNMDTNASMRYVAMALQGETTVLRRYIPELRAEADIHKQIAIIRDKAAAGLRAHMETAKTSLSSTKQLWNALGDVAEKVGKIFSTALLPTIQKLTAWLTYIQKPLAAWIERNKALILRIVTTTVKLAVLLVILPKLVAALSGLIAVVKGLAVAMAFASGNPLVAIIGGVVALTAVLWGAKAASSAVQGSIGKLGDSWEEAQAQMAATQKKISAKITLPEIKLPTADGVEKAAKKSAEEREKWAEEREKWQAELEFPESRRDIGEQRPEGLRAGQMQTSFTGLTDIWQNIASKMGDERRMQLEVQQEAHQKSMKDSLVEIQESSRLTVEVLQGGVPAVAAS